MQLRHFKTCHGASDLSLSEGNSFKFQKVTAIAFAPNNSKFAVATVDRYITLYDENGEQKDRFPTKPADKDPASPPAGPTQPAAGGSKNYTVRALEFSSDSTKLAVAQSDKIVFVYKLGLQWGERKTICNKFPQPSPVTTMCWPSERPNEVVLGLADGQVRVGALRNNKSFGLFQTDSYVISLCPSPEGDAFVSGHLDGSVYRYTFGDPAGNFGPSQALLFHTNFVPYSLAWGEHVCVAGNSPKVQFWDLQGQLVNTIDYSSDEKCKEFTCAAMNPSGQTVVLGNYDRFFVYAYDQSRRSWNETASLSIPNLLSVTALRWRTDGSRLCVGSLCGAVDLFDACLKRYRYKGKFEFTYTSISSAVIKRLSTGTKMSFRSRFNLEIKKINVYSDRYLVASTPETLILGDLELDKFSEVQWSGSGKERFYFEIASAAMIFNAGELFIVEYGANEILGSCRTEHMSPHLVSALINSTPKADAESKAPTAAPVKKIAYLLDSATIRVLDLCTNVTEATLTHDSKIDFLELSHRGTKLLFRDKRRSLHLFDIASQTRTTLLEFCNYVQWVPDSDVAVAQNRRNLCIWYSIDSTEQVTTVPIKGDVLQIERAKGRTEVIIDEGISQTAYPLDETLISFGTAVEDKQFERAVSILEELSESTAAAQGMWLRLSKLATEAGALAIAERCFAALGDVSKAQCLRKLNRMATESAGGFNNYLVRAKLAILNKQFKRAEAIYLEQGQVPLAIEMYRTHHKWDSALSLAQARNHPSLAQLRADYLEYLMSSDQLELAGELKEKEGDFPTAIDLYLRGNTPARASQLIISQGLVQDANLLQTVATALLQKGDFERAGEFYEALSYHENALEMYRRARVYRKAVELCRRNFPHYVVRLEEEWGDWLVTQKQSEAAVAHFTECGQYLKAVNAAIEAKQWNKLKILEHLEPEVARPFYKKIAQHYAEIKQFELAEQHYLQGQFYQEAVLMYANAGLWDKGLKIAQSYMSERELRELCLSQGQALETKGKFAEAEKLYLMTNEPQRAITMYKKNRQYDEMIRLVSQYRKDLLEDTHLHLAKQFQAEGNLKMAEQHYAKTRDWQSCVNMYKAQNMTNEMLRVARAQGGPAAHRLVAYEYALSLGMEGCIKLLEKLGLGEACVELALERSEYGPAQAIAEALCKQRLPDVFLHHALALEDLGQFAEAEAEFLKANKPKEAIDMYNHQQMWSDSMRVAESAMPSAILDVLEAQAKAAIDAQSFSAAEQIYLTSLKRPEAAVRMYIDAKQFPDAIRIAKTHAPQMLSEISTAQQLAKKSPNSPMIGVPETLLSGPAGLAPSDDSNFLVNQARALEAKGQHSQAIDKLIRITADFGSDPNQLEAAWEHAVSLAMEHVPERTNEVVRIATDRLCDLKRFDAAAEIYLGIDAHKEALDVYIRGGLFEKALMIATKRGPQFVQYVRNAQQEYALHSASIAQVVEPTPLPSGAAAIEMYANNGEWDKVYAEAEKQGSEVVQRFASLHAKALVRDNQFVSALHVISQRGVVAVAENYPLYNRVAKEILGHVISPSEEKGADNSDLHLELRQVLFKLVSEMKDIGADANARKEFERLLLICHFVNMRKTTAKLGLDATSTRLAVSLLRYTNEVPVDQAFFDAGSACRKIKWNNMAFVFFNRFVDINEMLSDPENADMDNVEFENTDIPQPYDVPAPTKQNFPTEVVEEVRDWVLEKAMDANVDANLSLRQCERCDKKTYEASLTCHNCRASCQPCTVSGYPIYKSTQVQCKSCNCLAIKSEWNQYVSKTKTCPWCGNVANPYY